MKGGQGAARRAAQVLALLLGALALLCLRPPGVAAAAPTIHLKSRTIQVADEPPFRPEASPRGRRAPRSLVETLRNAVGKVVTQEVATLDPRWHLVTNHFQQYLLALDEPLGRSRAKAEGVLAAHGGWLVDYLPHNSFLAVGPVAAILQLQQTPGVAWAGPALPADKLYAEWDRFLAFIQQTDGINSSAPSWSIGTKDPYEHFETVQRSDGQQAFVMEHLRDSGADNDRVLRLQVSVVPWYPADISATRRNATQVFIQGLTREWVEALRNITEEGAVQVSASHSDELNPANPTILISVGPAHLAATADWLTEQEAAHFVSPRWRSYTSNNGAAALVQSGTVDEGGFESRTATAHPLWDAGLMGENEVVGLGDTGIDMNSCFFNDLSGTDIGPNHRKVVYYDSLGGIGDNIDANGHGSHCAGSLAGNAVGSFESAADMYAGMAPGAKLAILDLQSEDDGDSLGQPTNMKDAYYQKTYDRGARIHSDSWGMSTNEYTRSSREVDQFTYTNQDFLPLFAAGNFGDVMSRSITSPSTAKNCIAVGATLGAIGDSPRRNGNVFVFESTAFDFSEKVLAAQFGPEFNVLNGQQLTLRLAEPAEACSQIMNDVTGHVAVLRRGVCYFSDKVRRAQAAGAVAVVVMNNQEGGFTEMAAPAWDSAADITIPSGLVPKSTGQFIQAIIGENPDAQFTVIAAALPENRFDNMADFSSIGPTLDMRIKPDLCAPGEEIDSVAANTPCAVSRMSGTSMSTPIVAGAAALVRQYFKEGFYPSGQAVPDDSIPSPSGPLVKAVLLNGAVDMTGFTEAGLPVEPAPSMRQGFGRVHLLNSVRLAGRSNTPSQMFVADREPIEDGQTIEYCVHVNSAGEAAARAEDFRATVVWHDAPASQWVSSDASQLVNDIDLKLRSNITMVGKWGSASEIYGNGGLEPDRVNNVERISVRAIKEAHYVLVVSAHRISNPPQPFSLVVTGPFQVVMKCNGAIITLGPEQGSVIASQSVSFSFALADSAATGILCRLQSDTNTSQWAHNWITCDGTRTYEGLEDGTYTFAVRSYIDVGASIPDSRTFIIDTTPPITELRTDDLDTAELFYTDQVEFYFTASENTLPITYECRLNTTDGSNITHEWKLCESPMLYTEIPSGEYTFSVRAIDGAGNVDPTPDHFSWEVDSSNLQTILTKAPDSLTTTSTFVFEFITDFSGSHTFECWLVKLPIVHSTIKEFEPCTSPMQYDCEDGRYQFSVRVVRIPGSEYDRTPATAIFNVDTGSPKVSLSQTPGQITKLASTSFYFDGEDRCADVLEQRCTFRCELKNGITNTVIYQTRDGCESPAVYLMLEDAQYLFEVRAIDTITNVEGPIAVHEFTLDRTPPNVSITSARQTSVSKVSVHFYSTDGPAGSGISAIKCRVAGYDDWRDCTNPEYYENLPSGNYTFEVSVYDTAGNEAQASASLAVDAEPPKVNITGVEEPGSGNLQDDQARFQFSALDMDLEGNAVDPETLECQLARISDFGTFVTPPPLHDFRNCTITRTEEYTDLPAGNLVFTVRARDIARNIGTAKYEFQVQVNNGASLEPNQTVPVSADAPASDGALGLSQQDFILFLAGVGVMIVIMVTCVFMRYVCRTSYSAIAESIFGPPADSESDPSRVQGSSQHLQPTNGYIPHRNPYGPANPAPSHAEQWRIANELHGVALSPYPVETQQRQPPAQVVPVQMTPAPAPMYDPRDLSPASVMVQCPICEGMLASVAALNMHLDEAHMLGTEQQSEIIRSVTPAATQRPSAEPQMQMESLHSVDMVEDQFPLPPDRGDLEAFQSFPDVNEESTSIPAAVQMHPPTAQAGRHLEPCTCPMCGEVCSDLGALNQHLDSVHQFSVPGTPPDAAEPRRENYRASSATSSTDDIYINYMSTT